MRSVLVQTLIALLLGGLFTACSTEAADQPSTPSATPMRLPVDVRVVSLSHIHHSETLAGSVLPSREVEIMSELTRKITMVAFRDGDHVTKGQLLYKLDDADIRSKIRQVEAELSLARINEKRFNQLLKTETVRQEEYDIALSKKLSLEASADYLYTELDKTSIRAPFSGRIGLSKVQVGALVSPGVALVQLQEQGSVKVQFSVPEKYLPMIRKGNRIYFSAGAFDSIMAVVEATEAGVDLQSRNINVHAVADNRDGKLQPGMSAKIHFNISGENAASIMLPTQAFIPAANGYSVFVVKNGAAKLTPVTIGNRNEEEAMVTAGLQNGDTVMISNILRASDGLPVQIVHQ